MKKKVLTIEQQLKKMKKRFITTLIILAAFVLASGTYFYLNYDYLAFKHFISQHYIYTDTLDELYDQELRRDVKGKYYSYFDDMVISVVTKAIREVDGDRYTYLYIPEAYEKYKEEEKQEALMSQVKELNNETVYLRVTNFSKHTKSFLKDNSDKLKEYPNIIIDLRNNYGGDVFAMNDMADLFLPKGNILAEDVMRIFNWTHKAKKKKTLDFEKIIILQNENTASASENFIAALNDNLDNILLIGKTTFGKGIGQYTLPLKRGFKVKATTMYWNTPGGDNIHRKGIKPDVVYEKEDIIEFALNQIQ